MARNGIFADHHIAVFSYSRPLAFCGKELTRQEHASYESNQTGTQNNNWEGSLEKENRNKGQASYGDHDGIS